MLDTTELQLLLLAVQSGLEGIKLVGYNLPFHSWPGNGHGCKRLSKIKIGKPPKNKEDRHQNDWIQYNVTQYDIISLY